MSKTYYNHTNRSEKIKSGTNKPATLAISRIGNYFYYGIVLCSKYDNFDKKIGRTLAEKRMNNIFGLMEVPEHLKSLSEKDSCLKQLYNLTESVLQKEKKWKSKITRYNHRLKTIESKNTISNNQGDIYKQIFNI